MNTQTTTTPARLWDYLAQMSEKYPNEKFWNMMTDRSIRYQDCINSLRGAYASIRRDAQNDLDQMDQGFNPWSLSMSSNAQTVAELRTELKSLEEQFKTFLYIMEISSEDKDLFWKLAQQTIKTGKA